MERNVGGLDRTVRYVLGAVLVIAALAGFTGMVSLAAGPVSGTIGAIIVLVVGAVLLWTAYTEKCMVNKLLGINTAEA